MPVLLSALLFCAFLPGLQVQAETMYQISETELTQLETNLETLKAHNKPFVENYVDTKHQLFPIPHSEFLLNPDWEQNPNYSK